MHNALAHTVAGEGPLPPPIQGIFILLYVPGTMICTGATASQSQQNIIDWVEQIIRLVLGARAPRHIHVGPRGPTPLLLEKVKRAEVGRLTL